MAETSTTKKASDAQDAQTLVPLDMKTTPNDRDLADSSTFAKSYLITVDSNKADLPVELIERQYTDMRQSAMQRGMFPVGLPKCVEQTRQGKTDWLLRYTLDVSEHPRAGAPDGVDEAQAVDPAQSATGEKFRKDDKSARTADGKTVDTTNPSTAQLGAVVTADGTEHVGVIPAQSAVTTTPQKNGS